MSSTNDKILERCFATSDKILNILNGLKYTSERKPSYENELRDLIAIEVRRNVNVVVADFYNSVAVVPVPNEAEVITGATETEEGCCGGGCGCHE